MGETGMETGRLRPLPLMIRDLDRPEIQAGKHSKIYAGPLEMGAAQSSIREEDKNVQKRGDFGLRFKPERGAVNKRERCSGEEKYARRRQKTTPRRIVILPQTRLMRLSVIPKRSSRQQTRICGSRRVAAGSGCRSSSRSLLQACSGEGLPVHRLQERCSHSPPCRSYRKRNLLISDFGEIGGVGGPPLTLHHLLRVKEASELRLPLWPSLVDWLKSRE